MTDDPRVRELIQRALNELQQDSGLSQDHKIAVAIARLDEALRLAEPVEKPAEGTPAFLRRQAD